MSRKLKIAEAAELLRVSTSTLYHMVSAKEIPHYKVGARVLFDEAELEAWIQARKVPSIAVTAVEGQK